MLIVLFAEEGLRIWLGAGFAVESTTVAKWLALGVFANSLAQVPFTLIQGAGRPDLTAKLHLAQLPPYLVGLWWFTIRYGIDGVGMMWTLRAVLDAALLFALVRRFVPGGADAVRRSIAASAIAVIAIALAALPGSVPSKLGYFVVALLGSALFAWRILARRVVAAGSLGYTQPRP
jgi:O-antigen/teichoic acid export membrane protein